MIRTSAFLFFSHDDFYALVVVVIVNISFNEKRQTNMKDEITTRDNVSHCQCDTSRRTSFHFASTSEISVWMLKGVPQKLFDELTYYGSSTDVSAYFDVAQERRRKTRPTGILSKFKAFCLWMIN